MMFITLPDMAYFMATGSSKKQRRSKKDVQPSPSKANPVAKKVAVPSKEVGVTRKLQISRKGVLIREIPTQASLASKKRRAEDMAKRISKKQKKQRNLLIQDDSMDEDIVPETQLEDN
ncbi:unnamed protein product [Lactuca saligna]|uniref:Uncharacterized protein n=1 Tax=Lactuca saligna TaxID=75948 RepID=A0AA35YNY6_LACSI|nr:unnamed protein product [Lactuca saligna]